MATVNRVPKFLIFIMALFLFNLSFAQPGGRKNCLVMFYNNCKTAAPCHGITEYGPLKFNFKKPLQQVQIGDTLTLKLNGKPIVHEVMEIDKSDPNFTKIKFGHVSGASN